MNQFPIAFACRLICCLACIAATLPLDSPGQELSEDQRKSLIAERDAKAEQAVAAAKKGDLGGSLKLFDQVIDIERSVFGDAHKELLGTLGYQAKIATVAKDWNGVTQYRRRAYEIGEALYAEGDYHLRDLELALSEARANATRTDEQRQLLSQAETANRQVGVFYRQGKFGEAIEVAKKALEWRGALFGNAQDRQARDGQQTDCRAVRVGTSGACRIGSSQYREDFRRRHRRIRATVFCDGAGEGRSHHRLL